MDGEEECRRMWSLTGMFVVSTCSRLGLELGADLIQKLVQTRISRRRAHGAMSIIHGHYGIADASARVGNGEADDGCGRCNTGVDIVVCMDV
jgi:hypothetical protein